MNKFSAEKTQKISEVVIKILYRRFEEFPSDLSRNRNAPFHKAFLQAFYDKMDRYQINNYELIGLSSWLHGLNTTLGQVFFEKVAHILSGGEKREFTSARSGALYITEEQQKAIMDIMTDLSNRNKKPDLERELQAIPKAGKNDLIETQGFSADVFWIDQNGIEAIELKTVKPNSGEMKSEKQKILIGRTALQNKYPDKDVHFHIGFPFDPTVDEDIESPCSYNKPRFLNSIICGNDFFDPKEVLLASELWDYLSGQKGTMEFLINIINTIATPEFMDDYNIVQSFNGNYNSNIMSILEKWNLFSEMEIAQYSELIKEKINNNRNLARVFNQRIINPDYNRNRYNELSKLF